MYLNKLIQGANSTRNYGYAPFRKNEPGTFFVQNMQDTTNFAKFNSIEPYDRKVHLSEDMSAKVSPFKNKKPFSKMLQSCDVKLAQDVIKDLNSSQR
jgi:hypothetical protein